MRRTVLPLCALRRVAASLATGVLITAQALASSGSGDCTADAGTLSGFKPTDCLNVPYTAIGGIPNGDRYVPPGFQVRFVLTSSPDLTIRAVGTVPVFTVTEIGLYNVHTLVFNPNTLDLGSIQNGTTTAAEVNALLLQGGGDICASLDLVGTSILVDNPDAGTLVPVGDPCFENGIAVLIAQHDVEPYVPDGYVVLYVLTSGNELIIQDVSSEPQFSVTAEGIYTIHTLVYDPLVLDLTGLQLGGTTGYQVNAQLYQGGGNICASLDMAGTKFSPKDCPDEECLADAGSLSSDAYEACLENGLATISATQEDAPVVPDGFSVLYVLTSGEDLVIEAVNGEPVFDVTEAGVYTIHTLVYDPATLDLSVVVFGETNGGDVLGIVVENGICASLDVTGAQVLITGDCEPEPCLADAGTLEADAFEACLTNGAVIITATPNGDINVPDGFAVVYLLTSGQNLVVVGLNDIPEFGITTDGSYIIHTLVHDPATFDPNTIVLGQTSAFALLSLFELEEICANLDAVGAPIVVTGDCPSEECEADAGTLSAVNMEVCADELNGSALAEAVHGVEPTVPAGHQLLYVLTKGTDLVVHDLGSEPSFLILDAEVEIYTIHGFVFDPAEWDPLDFIEVGTTTGADVLGLIDDLGVCASLDPFGAKVQVLFCDEEVLLGASLSITAWPNPARDVMTLEVQSSSDSRVEYAVFDHTGRQVTGTQAVPMGMSRADVNVGQLRPGQYHLRVISGATVLNHVFLRMD